MKKLGISVYPEHASKEECYAYMRLAGSLGYKRVFTCLLSVEESKEQIIKEFSEFCQVAHESGLTVSVDTNPKVFTKLGATPFDLSVFAEIGVDIIRLDGHFGEFEDIEITKNPQNIMIEYNASFTVGLDLMIEGGANKSNMCICSNFYPQRYTGMGLERFKELNGRYQPLGLNNAAFVTSQEEYTHGPWKVYDGLPTLEIHRDLPIDLQVRHLNALGYNNDFMIGNAFASEAELRSVAEINLNKIVMKLDLAEGVSEAEKAVISCRYHQGRDDSNELIVRSSAPRLLSKDHDIAPRKHGREYFKKGDVLVVNNHLKHYTGEVIMVLSEIKALSYHNYVGHLNEGEQLILDCIKPRYSFELQMR